MQGRRRKARNPRFSNRLNGVLQLAATNGNGIAREKVLVLLLNPPCIGALAFAGTVPSKLLQLIAKQKTSH